MRRATQLLVRVVFNVFENFVRSAAQGLLGRGLLVRNRLRCRLLDGAGCHWYPVAGLDAGHEDEAGLKVRSLRMYQEDSANSRSEPPLLMEQYRRNEGEEMKLAALLCSILLGCGIVLAQEQSSGTVNSLSVDPQQNQKLSGSMGTETGQPNDVSRGADRNRDLGNPSNRPISGQVSSGPANAKPTPPGGSPSANQKSASTNSKKAPRQTDNSDSTAGTSSRPH